MREKGSNITELILFHFRFIFNVYPYVINIFYIIFILFVDNKIAVWDNVFFWLYLLSTFFIWILQRRLRSCRTHHFLIFNPILYPLLTSVFPALCTTWLKLLICAFTAVFMMVSAGVFLRDQYRRNKGCD